MALPEFFCSRWDQAAHLSVGQGDTTSRTSHATKILESVDGCNNYVSLPKLCPGSVGKCCVGSWRLCLPEKCVLSPQPCTGGHLASLAGGAVPAPAAWDSPHHFQSCPSYLLCPQLCWKECTSPGHQTGRGPMTALNFSQKL